MHLLAQVILCRRGAAWLQVACVDEVRAKSRREQDARLHSGPRALRGRACRRERQRLRPAERCRDHTAAALGLRGLFHRGAAHAGHAGHARRAAHELREPHEASARLDAGRARAQHPPRRLQRGPLDVAAHARGVRCGTRKHQLLHQPDGRPALRRGDCAVERVNNPGRELSLPECDGGRRGGGPHRRRRRRDRLGSPGWHRNRQRARPVPRGLQRRAARQLELRRLRQRVWRVRGWAGAGESAAPPGGIRRAWRPRW